MWQKIGVFIFVGILFFGGACGVNKQQQVELGHRLFFDKNLSANATKSCASCHAPELAFTDGYRQSVGAFADLHVHNSPSLLVIGAYKSLNWKSPNLHILEEQIRQPIFGITPVEMGQQEKDYTFLKYLDTNSHYQPFLKGKKKADWQTVINALSAYTRSLNDLKVDTFFLNKMKKNSLEWQGYMLFQQEKCQNCHASPYFTDQQHHAGVRTPNLQNVALTAPYLHDGSAETLQYAIERHQLQTQQRFSKEDWQKMTAFLFALTDTAFLKKPHFLN